MNMKKSYVRSVSIIQWFLKTTAQINRISVFDKIQIGLFNNIKDIITDKSKIKYKIRELRQFYNQILDYYAR